jgi:hypothetical protein
MHLHLISFDVPYPADYGGVIDVFYKIIQLHKAGVKIHLHCYQYGRSGASELLTYCETVNYYPRSTKNIFLQFSLTPFTVLTRQSSALEDNLLKNDYPILFEVLHTCYLLKDERFKHRIKLYRHSNIEHEYYRQLAQSEKSVIKRWYLKLEAIKLKRFEPIIQHASTILAVNEKDVSYFKKNYPKVASHFLPSFHANEMITVKKGRGDTVLFHGNLSISENYESVQWLMTHVFSRLPDVSFIIAGKNPPEFLEQTIDKYANINLIKNPSEVQLSELIHEAQIHCLHTHQGTGLKLKLLNVLFQGRFVICNSEMLNGTSFPSSHKEAGVYKANTANEYIEAIQNLLNTTFEETNVHARETFLKNYMTEGVTSKLIEMIKQLSSQILP